MIRMVDFEASFINTFLSSSCNFANDETRCSSEFRFIASPFPVADPWGEFLLVAMDKAVEVVG